MVSMSTAKSEIIKKYQQHDTDTASPQVQIALLTSRLVSLNDHFAVNKKDHHSRQGLIKMVGQRRRLLNYLHKTNIAGYKELIKDLGIRR